MGKCADFLFDLAGRLHCETFPANVEVNNALICIEEITRGCIPHLMQTYPDLIENITRVMKSRGITRGHLVDHVADAAIIDRTFDGQRYLDGSMLAKLANALGVSIEELKTK